MLRKDPRKLYRHQFENMLKEKGITPDYEIMAFIFNEENDFKLTDTYLPLPKTTILNRLNSLWVYPLYLLTIAPVYYIIKGQTGVSRETKMGQILTYLLGEYY